MGWMSGGYDIGDWSASDAVRDGRHLMENDGLGRIAERATLSARDYASALFYVLAGERGIYVGPNPFKDAPEHPNFREQYQRVVDASI